MQISSASDELIQLFFKFKFVLKEHVPPSVDAYVSYLTKYILGVYTQGGCLGARVSSLSKIW